MKSLAKILWISAGAVLALAIVLVALLLQPAPQTSTGVVFAAAEPVDVSAVEVENATGTYRFYYEDDGYVLDDIPASIADLDAFIHFMTNCAQLSAIQQVDSASSAGYGLENPAAVARIQFFEGEPVVISIGGQEPISGNYYVSAEGFDGVYLMAQSLAEPFLLPKTQIISKTVTPQLAVSSPLSAIRDVTFTGGLLERPVTIQATSGGDETVKLAGLAFGTATHLVQSVGTYQLDQTYGIEVLGSLFGIPVQEVVGYNLGAAELSNLGFDSPWMTVEYDMVNNTEGVAEHCTLKLVSVENGGFYATMEGSGAVFLMGEQAFMNVQYDKLLLRWFLTPLLMDLSAITIEGDGQQHRFEIDNTDPLNTLVTMDGVALDIDLFRSFFRLITSAAHDGNYLGEQEQPDFGALLFITYEYNQTNKDPDVLALYPGEVRRVNVFVNGAGEFAMKDQFVSRVLEGCLQMQDGQPVEENW